MKSTIFKVVVVLVPALLSFWGLVYLIYDVTGIGYMTELSMYTPVYAPLWFESIVTVICVPFIVGYTIYDGLYN